MEQATIAILDSNGNEKSSVSVQFNPSEYSTTKSAKYTSGSQPIAQSSADNQFVAEDDEVLKLKLTLDGFTAAGVLDPEKAEDVCDSVNFFRGLVSIDASLHKPPECRFSWGSFTFTGYVQSVGVSYTMFASSGKPIRAAVDLSIKSSDSKTIAKESPDRTKRKVLTQDTPLYMVAYDAYNDPSQWRRIAVANGIKNPRRLNAGTVLKVPPMEFDKP